MFPSLPSVHPSPAIITDPGHCPKPSMPHTEISLPWPTLALGFIFDPQSMDPGAAASGSPGNLLEMQSLRSHPP